MFQLNPGSPMSDNNMAHDIIYTVREIMYICNIYWYLKNGLFCRTTRNSDVTYDTSPLSFKIYIDIQCGMPCILRMNVI